MIDLSLLNLLGKEAWEDCHGSIVFLNGTLTSLSAWRGLCKLFHEYLVFDFFSQILLSLLFGVLGHLVQHSGHFTRSFIDVNSVILFSLLVSEDLHTATSTILSLPLFILDHHTLILLGEHLPSSDIDRHLSLSLLLLLDFCLLLELRLPLFIFFFRNGLHSYKFILFFFESFGCRLSVGNNLRKLVHIL